MKYNGIEFTEFKSDKPVAFNPPKQMLVWNFGSEPVKSDVCVYAYLPDHAWPVKCSDMSWRHCAEIPDAPKPRRATNRELARWLAQGNGLYKNRHVRGQSYSDIGSNEFTLDDECSTNLLIRKWEDNEWHEPTVDYMGLE